MRSEEVRGHPEGPEAAAILPADRRLELDGERYDEMMLWWIQNAAEGRVFRVISRPAHNHRQKRVYFF